MHHVLQEAAREREIEERERKLGALMAEKGAIQQKKKTSKVCMPSDGTTCINTCIQLHCSFDMIVRDSPQEASLASSSPNCPVVCAHHADCCQDKARLESTMLMSLHCLSVKPLHHHRTLPSSAVFQP